ncbi:hypothetical protein DQ04_05201040 [Trypanosoma grayi]|uniref:hypothetical protein n=1 Tax=Trypanosoma grayi TaxID=71804 RepID=UPI0004F4A050|nr:hypothetical protein DQ04_05201040 [Trypanosoma grayi]KEG09452.1 hypothetical protein DQ04_05201040 [Trypanosoma grayi]
MAEASPLHDGASNGKQHPVLDDEAREAEEPRRERVAQLTEDNLRLKARQSQMQDQLEELKRQLYAERSARQSLSAELEDVKDRLRRAKDLLDQQKRDHSGVSLQLCTVTAERDELEAKVSELWRSMSTLEKTVHVKEAANKTLRESLDNEKKERAAQEVLMSAMVTQLAALEQQQAAGASAEERHRRLGEGRLRDLEEEARRIAVVLDGLVDGHAAAPLDQQRDLLLLTEDEDDGDPDAALAVDDGLNTSDVEGAVTPDAPRPKSGGRPLSPVYAALRRLRHQLQLQRDEREAMQHDRRVLESHITALKDELRHVGSDGDGVREQLFRSEAQRAQVTETLDSMRRAREQEATQAAETRRKAALMLHCMDDWCVIEQHIADLVQEVRQLRNAVEESRRAHEAYVVRKEEEVDRIMDSHQRDTDAQQQQIEQTRHECERFKRIAAATTAVGVGGGTDVNTSVSLTELRREHEALKAKYHGVLQYMESELAPLTAEQAKALQEGKQREEELRRCNDALRLELKMLSAVRGNSSGHLSLFEALVLTLRVLSGAMADVHEMAQQRTALTRYILAYERMFGALSTCGGSPTPLPLLRFRRTVVAVLAARRLSALRKTAWRRSGVILGGQRGSGRIRLPAETCCLVRGGLIQLPPIEADSVAEAEREGNAGDDIIFVAEEELQLPHMSRKTNYNALGVVATQSLTLRGFIDVLLTFVTVPSALRPLHDAKEPLWRRLASGLYALQQQYQQKQWMPSQESRQTFGIPQRLLHLPPRHAEQASVALEWPTPAAAAPSSNGPAPPAVGVAVATAERLPGRSRESVLAPREPSARALSYSPGHLRETDAGRSSRTYPVPQPSPQVVQDGWRLEEDLQRSLHRDTLNSSVAQESQTGNGFASEVLSVIRALDQRVLGALERGARVREPRPRR